VHGRRATRKSELLKRESIPVQRSAPQRHARQLIHVLERFGIEPDGRLTPQELAGLPLPERLFE
jgi:hypothetical protein